MQPYFELLLQFAHPQQREAFMSSVNVKNTNAVFTSVVFPRDWHPDGGDSHPPPGRDFAIKLGDAFVEAGWDVCQMDPSSDDPNSLWWEHTYWFLFLTHTNREYFVQIEPIDNGDLWRVAFSLRRGCLAALFGNHEKSLEMPESLQSDVSRIIVRLTNCRDLRWVTEDEAIAMW